MTATSASLAAAHPVIASREITKVYGEDDVQVVALGGVSLDIDAGDYVAIMGASGSGKSTLMHIIGCLDGPTTGRYFLDGMDVSKLDDFALSVVRNHKIGFVFQSFNLIARTTALATSSCRSSTPTWGRRSARSARWPRCAPSVWVTGPSISRTSSPAADSNGVALARAIVTDPAIILADEPTGLLDSAATVEVLELFQGLNDEGRTIVVITHEHDVAERARTGDPPA